MPNTDKLINQAQGDDIIDALNDIKDALANSSIVGDTDISEIADGTLTGAVAEFDNDIAGINTTLEDYNVDTLPDTTPYVYRQSPAIGTRMMENALVGGSFGVNQIVQNGNFANGTTSWELTDATASVSGGVCSITPTASGINLKQVCVRNKVTHKMLVSVFVKSTSDVRVAVQNSQYRFSVFTSGSGNWEHIIGIYTSVESVEVLCFHSDGTAFQVKDCNIVDLTQYFGSESIPNNALSKEQSTAGSGIAWLKSQGFDFSKYIAYNTGTLESVDPSAKKVVGFNVWDEVEESGSVSEATGELHPNNDYIRSKNYISLLPGIAYYFKSKNNQQLVLYMYDSGKNYIGFEVVTNSIYTVPYNCRYARIRLLVEFVQYSIGDICINISETSKNGTYLPYESETHSISQSPLRGVPQLVNDAIVYDGDVRLASGETTRKYCRVDLGTLDWVYSGGFFITDSLNTTIKRTATTLEFPKVTCVKYLPQQWETNYDKRIAVSPLGNTSNQYYLWISDSSYTDAATFKTAMSGVYLDYELATPTTESLPPYTNPQKSFVGGTEEFITDNDVPVGHQSEYKSLPALFDDDYIQTIAERAENAASKVTPYLQIMDNNVAIDVNNYRIYFHSTSTPYALVNKAEMLSHRFLFVELFYNNGTPTNKRIISSALIDPNSLDGYFYEIEISNNDTLDIESYPDTDEFAITLFTTGSYNDGDPTDYYLTIRLVD